jgi:hypothetical protein
MTNPLSFTARFKPQCDEAWEAAQSGNRELFEWICFRNRRADVEFGVTLGQNHLPAADPDNTTRVLDSTFPGPPQPRAG